jgi:hypothetical protein
MHMELLDISCSFEQMNTLCMYMAMLAFSKQRCKVMNFILPFHLFRK